ncbi:MAG: hypothetical protein V1754_07035, partial [Pseudomonadota bacterium]
KDDLGENAAFFSPSDVAYCEKYDRLYVADSQNHCIRAINLKTTEVTTFAGKCTQSGTSDGSRKEARFNNPMGIVVAPDSTLYVADTDNHTIRKITQEQVTTYAGTANQTGFVDGSVSSAKFNTPTGLALLKTNPIALVVADSNNHKIRGILCERTQQVWTIAGGISGYYDGTPDSAQFYLPYDVTSDLNGKIFVADKNNNRIRLIGPVP